MHPNKKEDEQFVTSVIDLVRKGSFTAVYQNTLDMQNLAKYASRKHWSGYQCRAMLAEIYDQVGLYKEAGQWATLDIGKKHLVELNTELKKKKPDRNSVRAHTWLILQCAVSQFRREDGKHNAKDLLKGAIELIESKGDDALSSQHIQSLLYFWRGRVYTSMYTAENARSAEDSFKRALKVVDSTLKEKLQQVEQKKLDSDKRDRALDRQVAAANYVLSACLGFGLAQLRQLEGRLVDSLEFLMVAVPLSRASGDFHRRGYTHMLMGTALRSQDDLDAAETELKIARRLFGYDPKVDPEPDTKPDPELTHIPTHRLHLARVYHQLALSKYNRVPPGGAKTDDDKNHLNTANTFNNLAKKLSAHEDYTGYHDHMLDYGITVVSSLIQTALGQYKEAHEDAKQAIMISNTVPEWTRGWAWVAKGMAVAERIETSTDDGGIKDAETAFRRVIEDGTIRILDRAAAHLHLARMYSKIGRPVDAAIHCGLAEPLVNEAEHGWIKKLWENTKNLTTLEPKFSIDIQELLNAASGEKAWRYIIDFIESETKRRLMWLKKDTVKESAGVEKLARELGVSRAAVFQWKKDPDIKRMFSSLKPSSEMSKRRKTQDK